MDTENLPIRILIVDDMAQVRHDLRAVLPLFGSEAGILLQVVGEAGDGQEAIQQAQDLQPDVVLMDLAMPLLDGYAATQAIKASHREIRVIALTVHSSPASREKALQAGADGFIEKGFSVRELVDVLCSIRKEK
jgi:NarL family two-component system response regulator LiaR